MTSATEVTKNIIRLSNQIIDNIKHESVDVYCFLKNDFINKDVSKDRVFQFMFRNYYKMDGVGLTDEFKNEYFVILEKSKNAHKLDLESVNNYLYGLTNPDRPSIQFSFATKLLNTVDDFIPIYDRNVAKVFTLSRPKAKTVSHRLMHYVEDHKFIKQSYDHILKHKMLNTSLTEFNLKFGNRNISEIKKLDFIFWSYGKLL